MQTDKVGCGADGRPMADRRGVQQRYARWFRDLPWSWYVTATFDREVTRERATTLFRTYIDVIERDRRCSLSALVALESMHWSGLASPGSGYHFHLLLRTPEGISAQDLKERWEAAPLGGTRCRREALQPCRCGNCDGGTMRVCHYDPCGNAAAYLFKGIHEHPDDWFLHREYLLGIRPVSCNYSTSLRRSVRRGEAAMLQR